MPREINGEVYLNGQEAQKHLGIGSYATFQAKRKEWNLQIYKGIAGNTIYFKQSDLDKVPLIKPVSTGGID